MFILRCLSYNDGKTIPARYVHGSIRGGKNVSPGFEWSGAPEGTVSFAFSIIDPHPVAKNWIHWLVTDIPVTAGQIPEGASRTGKMPMGSRELQSTYNEEGYGGPAPPRGSGPHPYVATLYALDVPALPLKIKSTREQFLNALRGHILAEVSTTGIYET
jgi:Raf kinase inhibitor-like YbhB/YbcL family protein